MMGIGNPIQQPMSIIILSILYPDRLPDPALGGGLKVFTHWHDGTAALLFV